MTEGILLPGFDCPACGMFTGTAKVDHVTCRCCGAPRPDDAPWGRRRDGMLMSQHEWAVSANLEHTIEANIIFHEQYKAMLENLTSTQERCTELLLEARKLRALLRRCESGPEDRFPECPICLTKWYEEPTQPHTPDCELKAALA